MNDKKLDIKSLPWWAIVLLVILFPIWFSILLAVVVVIFSLIITVASVYLAFWCINLALLLVVLTSLISVFCMLVTGSILSAVIYLGILLVATGLCILGVYGCVKITKYMWAFLTKLYNGISTRFSKKEVQ